MLLDIFRLLFIVILVLVIIFDVNVPIILNTQVNQLIIAILIIFIIIAVDEIIGFLLGCIFLIIYFKYYQKMINTNNKTDTTVKSNDPLIRAYSSFNTNEIDSFVGDTMPKPNSKIQPITEHYTTVNKKDNCVEMPYISEELLLKAQTNIYDEKNYYTEIKNSDNTYGIQGLNSDLVHYSAYDKKIMNEHYNNL
jgi:hypothetical protein